MKWTLLCSCCLSLVIIKASSTTRAAPQVKLELVQVLFRHGARTPLDFEYDLFNYTDRSLYEPYGLGQLTNKGKRQAYDLGVMLRHRYTSFLGADLASSDVRSYASENSRAAMSLQLALAGLLMRSSARSSWHPRLEWTPVPYRSVPRRWDIVLNSNGKPKLRDLRSEAKASAEYRAALASQQDFFNSILEKPFVNKSGTDDIALLVGSVFNVLRSNEAMELPLPDWYTGEVRRSFVKLFNLDYDVNSSTREMKRLNGGVLLRQFLRNVDANENGRSRRKLYLYSAHDLNIAALQRTLGVEDRTLPDFASALVFEQYRDERDEVYVKLFTWDTVRNRTESLRLAGCDELCRADEFVELLRDVIPTDDECRQLLGSDLDSNVLNRLYENFF